MLKYMPAQFMIFKAETVENDLNNLFFFTGDFPSTLMKIWIRIGPPRGTKTSWWTRELASTFNWLYCRWTFCRCGCWCWWTVTWCCRIWIKTFTNIAVLIPSRLLIVAAIAFIEFTIFIIILVITESIAYPIWYRTKCWWFKCWL